MLVESILIGTVVTVYIYIIPWIWAKFYRRFIATNTSIPLTKPNPNPSSVPSPNIGLASPKKKQVEKSIDPKDYQMVWKKEVNYESMFQTQKKVVSIYNGICLEM
jgi:hypothetical protein